MGYHATSTGSLTLRAGVDESAIVPVLDQVAEIGDWEFDLADGQLNLYFDANYRPTVADALRLLLPFVEDGQYLQLVGEDQAVWRLHFRNGSIVQENARWDGK